MKAQWTLKGKAESRYWLDLNTGERIRFNQCMNPPKDSNPLFTGESKVMPKAKKPVK